MESSSDHVLVTPEEVASYPEKFEPVTDAEAKQLTAEMRAAYARGAYNQDPLMSAAELESRRG
jgi:hypothetical protein